MTDRDGRTVRFPPESADVYELSTMPPLRPDAPLSLKLTQRFFGWLRIADSGCWEWTRTLQKDGYGQVNIGGNHYHAHRLSYLLFVGPIPDGLFVLHRCDNRPCCNPFHLFTGTQSDNIRDMYAKGRGTPPRKICRKNLHPMDEANTIVWSGKRLCRICHQTTLERWKARQQAKSVA